MSSLVMLALLLGMCAVAGVDAIRDKTPRKPWVWARPPLDFWAQRRTRRERARIEISLSSERTAQVGIPSPASPSQESAA